MKKTQIKHYALLSILLCNVLIGCKPSNGIINHQEIQYQTDNIFNNLVEIRRDFHEYPELAGNEKRTSNIIASYLLDLGLEVERGFGGYGVIGILKGDKEGKSIAWRADMDALPHDFPDDVEFKSKVKGVQHGCGHDVHMAIGLGIAEVLSKYKSSLNGTIYFIFQPEEETFLGAEKMIKKDLFTVINPDEIFALHVTALPVGKIMVKPNEVFAYQKRIEITLNNKISEEEAIELYNGIKSFIKRIQPNSEPWNIQHVIDPEIGLSDQNTPFKDYSFMDENPSIESSDDKVIVRAYLYETTQMNLESILPKIKKFISDSKYKDFLNSVSFIQENPTVFNDEELTKQSISSLAKIYGNELVLPAYGQIPFFNDDFCYFQQEVPGVYFLLGGSNFEKGIIAMNHAPDFKVDEECIRVGVKSFTSLILERLSD